MTGSEWRGHTEGPLASHPRTSKQALESLKVSAMTLLADGVDIGNMRITQLIDLQPARLEPLRTVGEGRPGAHGKAAMRRKASGEIQLRKAYGGHYDASPFGARW